MSPPILNAKSPTIRRILKEASELSANPDPTIHAAPLETDLFDWHFTIQGPPSTPYDNGIYHGRIVLPQQYPLRPPIFRFLTPSGRFEVNREICLSISGHHEETWQPAWGIRTALAALRAFMEGGSKGQVGGMNMPDGERRRLAEESKKWRCTGCGSGTNQEILDSHKGEGRRLADDSRSREAIPDELRFGFKDEMTKSAKEVKSPPEEPSSSSVTSSPTLNANSALTTNNELTFAASSQAHNNGQSQFSERRSPPMAILTQTQSGITPDRVATQHDSVPPWIDKLIVALIAILVIMVIKKLFT